MIGELMVVESVASDVPLTSLGMRPKVLSLEGERVVGSRILDFALALGDFCYHVDQRLAAAQPVEVFCHCLAASSAGAVGGA